MVMLITLIILVSTVIVITGRIVIKARGNRKISWAATIVLIIAITGLSYVGYIGYALIRYFVCIPAQGAISGVMPDTSWIKESRDVLYLNGDKLYSIKINGTDKKLIYDNVRYYALSPNGKKIVIEYLSKSLIKDDRNIEIGRASCRERV